MCGIVGAVAQRDVIPLLLEGLKRLEYRGYDSAGLVVAGDDGDLKRWRSVGKVAALEQLLEGKAQTGNAGLAHTRWATHGAPSEKNAHPHVSGGRVALVHNGIIENHDALRGEQLGNGYAMSSETDTEVIAHEIHSQLQGKGSLLAAVQATVARLEGAYAVAVMDAEAPGELVAARRGSPLVVGIGIGEHFVASDVNALLPVTRKFIFLEEGDVVAMTREQCRIFDSQGQPVERPRCRLPNCPRMQWSVVLIGILCSRRYTSSRAQ